MPATKIAITMEEDIVRQIDRLVKEGKYRSRSNAIQEALKDRLRDWRRSRLLTELASLNPEEEREFADEALHLEDEEWEKY
jgi:Arc/MetJ-type ribon-helix-helix transcriptional regulator